MRIRFQTIDAPKRATKLLARMSPDLRLSHVRNLFARVAGYRDWHDVEQSVGTQPSPARVHRDDAHPLIIQIAKALGLDVGDVIFALTSSAILRSDLNCLAAQTELFLAAVRDQHFGPRGRGRPGTVVRVKAHGESRHAYLIRDGRPSRVYYDTGGGICADFEAVVPRRPLDDFLPARLWLPYGVWGLEDGSEVVFSRDYYPLWRVGPSGTERLEPWLWIHGIRSRRWFAANTEGDWWRPEARSKALSFLAEHRIAALPKLVDAMPLLFDEGVETLQDAVRQLYASRPRRSKFPAFASRNCPLVEDWSRDAVAA